MSSSSSPSTTYHSLQSQHQQQLQIDFESLLLSSNDYKHIQNICEERELEV